MNNNKTKKYIELENNERITILYCMFIHKQQLNI